MTQMRFGIMSFAAPPFEDLVQRFREAEDLGFASAWVNDDVLMPDRTDLEPWTLLAAVARETSRLQLGTLVTVITFRHPSFLAAQVITLDHLSGGRAALGFGTGGPPNNYGALGYDDWSSKERTERLEEQAAVLAPFCPVSRSPLRAGIIESGRPVSLHQCSNHVLPLSSLRMVTAGCGWSHDTPTAGIASEGSHTGLLKTQANG